MLPRVSFDDIVGTEEQRRWDLDTQRFRGLKIDDELKLSRLLHGDINHFSTKQQLYDLTSALTDYPREAGTIGNQTARFSPFGPLPNGW